MLTWDDVLAAPAFLINLDRCPERLKVSMERLREAGFKDVRRVRAVDAKCDDLAAAWAVHGSPAFNRRDQEFCETYKGKQGCFLSHAGLLQREDVQALPFFLVFEDDILLHPEFATLAPKYWETTPQSFDMLYLGSQLDLQGCPYPIVQFPCFCTNAMAFTGAGAKKVYDYLMSQPQGVCTIDCMLKEYHEDVVFRGRPRVFEWYVWNATMFPAASATMPKDWTKRNSGLVFQDETFGSDVRPW
jgi:Glycosyltransferase family 25 (LPS biosynthesis protein)